MFQAIPIGVFEERTGIIGDKFFRTPEIRNIVSLRNLKEVLQIYAMPMEYLQKLLLSITIVGDETCKVYKDRRMKRMRVDPRGVRVGQTFIERPKYQKILEDFSSIFSGFDVTSGFAKCTSWIIIGRTESGEVALAHYLPPIFEVREGGRMLKLLDGVHRSFLVRAVGTTIEAIVFYDVRVPFPCDTREWDKIRTVEEKPPPEERFFNLQKEYFRDLKRIGIDG